MSKDNVIFNGCVYYRPQSVNDRNGIGERDISREELSKMVLKGKPIYRNHQPPAIGKVIDEWQTPDGSKHISFSIDGKEKYMLDHIRSRRYPFLSLHHVDNNVLKNRQPELGSILDPKNTCTGLEVSVVRSRAHDRPGCVIWPDYDLKPQDYKRGTLSNTLKYTPPSISKERIDSSNQHSDSLKVSSRDSNHNNKNTNINNANNTNNNLETTQVNNTNHSQHQNLLPDTLSSSVTKMATQQTNVVPTTSNGLVNTTLGDGSSTLPASANINQEILPPATQGATDMGAEKNSGLGVSQRATEAKGDTSGTMGNKSAGSSMASFSEADRLRKFAADLTKDSIESINPEDIRKLIMQLPEEQRPLMQRYLVKTLRDNADIMDRNEKGSAQLSQFEKENKLLKEEIESLKQQGQTAKELSKQAVSGQLEPLVEFIKYMSDTKQTTDGTEAAREQQDLSLISSIRTGLEKAMLENPDTYSAIRQISTACSNFIRTGPVPAYQQGMKRSATTVNGESELDNELGRQMRAKHRRDIMYSTPDINAMPADSEAETMSMQSPYMDTSAIDRYMKGGLSVNTSNNTAHWFKNAFDAENL